MGHVNIPRIVASAAGAQLAGIAEEPPMLAEFLVFACYFYF